MGVMFAVCIGAFFFASDGKQDAASVAIHTIDGRSESGQIVSWRLGGKLIFRNVAGREVKLDSSVVDHLTFAWQQSDRKIDSPSRRTHDGWIIETSDHTRLHGDIVGGDDDNLVIRHPQLGEIKIPLERLTTIVRQGSATEELPRRSQDTILLANGDVTVGTLISVSQDGVKIFDNDIELVRSWLVIRAIRLSTTPLPLDSKTTLLLTFVDQSMVLVRSLTWRDQTVKVQMGVGQRIEFEPSFLAYAEVLGGRRTWLSDLPPAEYRSMPFFDHSWPLGVNVNALGGKLRMLGRTYHHGLGLHAACRIAWPLAGQYERLSAFVGIDDSAGRFADADVKILLDDRVVAEFGGLRHRETPRRISVDLRGGRELVIEVGYGHFGDVQDRVDVVNPMMIRVTKDSRPQTVSPH